MGQENKYYDTEGIIVRKVRLGEAARILTILTPSAGKVSAVAKGVCRSSSKMSGHLELFTHSQIELARGRSIDTVINCQTIQSFHHAKSDLTGSAYATYFCELSDAFSEHNLECRSLFALLGTCLARLNEDLNRAELVRCYFELQCLAESGFRPQSRVCVSCQGTIRDETNYFSLSSGGILCPFCSQYESFSFPVSLTAIKILRVLSEENLETCLRLRIKPEGFSELNLILGRFICYVLERTLRTPAWIAKVRSIGTSQALRTP